MTQDGKLSLGLSVEGQTEKEFIRVVICPYFESRGVSIEPVSIDGNVSVDKFKHRIRKFFHEYDHVGTFYDIYGFKDKQKNKTKASLENRLAEAVKSDVRHRFIPYVRRHEFESLLFSDPSAIAEELGDKSVVKLAQNLLGKVGNDPERINNSRDTSPSRILAKNASYKKTKHGPAIARRIGIDKMRERCAGFNGWLEKLECLTP